MCRARSRLSIVLDETEKKYPRIFNLAFVAVVLLGLVGLSMLCGHFLAIFERESELDDIHSSLGFFIEASGDTQNLVTGVERTYEDCLDSYLQNQTDPEFINGTDLKAFMNVCKIDGLEEANTAVTNMQFEEGGKVISNINLNWNRCFQSKDDPEEVKPSMQNIALSSGWFDHYTSALTEHLSSGMDMETANEIAKEGSRSYMDEVCSVNTAGGAMFWFTIMTTIGYGNTAPVTAGGRLLVYTAGFLSILIFTALIGMAGYIIISIVDDILCSMKLNVLTKGWPSVLFWLFNLWLWTLALAGISRLYQQARYDNTLGSYPTFGDQFWWAYITITTVGFGDYYVPHETFLPYDMLYIPLAILLGFVFLANFGLKLSETIHEKMERVGIVDDDSLGDLLKANRGKKDNENPPPEFIVETEVVEER